MALVEVFAVDADSVSSTPPISLFVLCNRRTSSSFSLAKCDSPSLHVHLLHPPTLYEADVTTSHKPRGLECSGAEYVVAVESAMVAPSSRYEFRWSTLKRTLTLMERAGFAVKFCAIELRASEDAATWRALLHQVTTQQREASELIAEKESQVQRCKMLLGQKEALLETALTAKQKVEDEVFRGFCAVLNAKKDEIQRLQLEVQSIQERHTFAMKASEKKKAMTPNRTRKAKGAKLRRKMEEEENEDEGMSDGSNKGSASVSEDEDEEEENLRNCAKTEGINAYSALPSNVRSTSVQISSAEDLLSSMDDIITNEEEDNEATQRGDSLSKLVATQPQLHAVEIAKPRTTKFTAEEAEPVLATKREVVKPSRLVSQVDEAMDSEEEDILDMLS